MDTAVLYNFYWEINMLTLSNNGTWVKKFQPPNMEPLNVSVFRYKSALSKNENVYEFSLNYYGEKEVNVEADITIESTPHKCFPGREIYTLYKNTPQRLVNVFQKDGTLQVTNSTIPIINNLMIFRCYFKFYISRNPIIPKEIIEPISKVKKSCNLCSDFKRLYDSKEMSDITIVIGKEYLLAHKLVLATRSPVFRAMMDNDWLESRAKTLTVTDTDLHAFDCFLKYLYFSEIVDKSYNAVSNLYILADKYQVDALKAECRDILNDEMKVDNVCHLLELAHLFTDDALKQKAIEFIERHFSQVSKMHEWIKICKDRPALASDVLAVLTISLNKSNQ